MLKLKPRSKSQRERNENLSFVLGIKNKIKEQSESTQKIENGEQLYLSTQPGSQFGKMDQSFDQQEQYTTTMSSQKATGENFGWKKPTLSSVPPLVTSAQSRAVLAGRQFTPEGRRRAGWRMCASESAYRNPLEALRNISVPPTPLGVNNGFVDYAPNYFEDKTPMRAILDMVHGPSTYNGEDADRWSIHTASVMQSPWVSRLDGSSVVVPSSPILRNVQPTFDSTNYSVKDLLDLMCRDAAVEEEKFIIGQDQQTSFDSVEENVYVEEQAGYFPEDHSGYFTEENDTSLYDMEQ